MATHLFRVYATKYPDLPGLRDIVFLFDCPEAFDLVDLRLVRVMLFPFLSSQPSIVGEVTPKPQVGHLGQPREYI